MRQLIYISTARNEITQEGLSAILKTSRRNNGRDGVTGLLVNGGKRFLQALEGPSVALKETFERISADPRHHAFVVLSSRDVPVRSFGDWSMAFQDGRVSDGGLSELVSKLTDTVSDKSLQAEFRAFAELHQDAN